MINKIKNKIKNNFVLLDFILKKVITENPVSIIFNANLIQSNPIISIFKEKIPVFRQYRE